MNEKLKNNKQVTVLILLVIAAATAIGLWYFNYQNNETTEETQASQQEVQSQAVISEDGKNIKYDGVNGKTALELLKQSATVDTQIYSGIGEYVTSVNGVEADSTNNFWAFYVNGEQAAVGAGEYTTTSSEKIEWRLEDVEAFQE